MIKKVFGVIAFGFAFAAMAEEVATPIRVTVHASSRISQFQACSTATHMSYSALNAKCFDEMKGKDLRAMATEPCSCSIGGGDTVCFVSATAICVSE